MRFAGVPYLLLAAIVASGCSAAGSSGIGAGDRSDAGGLAGAQGGGGRAMGGNSGSRSDAGMLAVDGARRGDGAVESVQSNLSPDAVTFNWDTYACPGCSGTGGAAAGGTSGTSTGAVPGGSGGKGAGGSTSSGGAGRTGMADASANNDVPPGLGGSSGSGGMAGTGGSMTVDAPRVSVDGGAMDARPPLSDLAVAPDQGPDLGQADSGGAGADARTPDTTPACVAQIVPVVPTLARLGRLVAGPDTKVVLHAEVTSGSLPPGTSWSWQGSTWEGAPLSVSAIGKQDPAAAVFAIANPGRYTFRATAGTCQVTVAGYAVASNICSPCDESVVLHSAPPVIANVPVQSGAVRLVGSSPFPQVNVVLERGVQIRVAPSVGSTVVKSYVRINDALGGLVVDGLADAQAGGFTTRLLALDKTTRAVLNYDVLVVPINGSDGETIGATAPQLYPKLAAASINGSFPLTGGVAVSGTTVSVSGQPLPDVRVMLTNQNPASAQQRNDLVFSSVGRSDAKGNYTLHVQKGTYWVSFSPSPDSGLGEALGASAIAIDGDATLAFKWDSPTTAALRLQVVDSENVPQSKVVVRATSSQSRSVGAATFTPPAGLPLTLSGNGSVQVESTTDESGVVVFPKLPANETYDILLLPAVSDLHATTTTMRVTLAAGGTSTIAQLWPQVTIEGQLSARSSSPLDYANVSIVAYDRSLDSPEMPRAILAGSNGRFSMGVTRGRPYVLLAVPDVGSGYARTFVGPGPMYASEFVVTQTLLPSMPWRATVMDGDQNGLADTALQIYCDASWPTCVDPGVPLAETTSEVGGAFQLMLPDPSGRL